MEHVMGNFVLWLLLPEQKEHRAAVANGLVQTATNEPDVLKKLRTQDELCVYSYDPETKAQASQWRSPGSSCPKKGRQSHSKMKTMLTVFFIGKVFSIMSTPLPDKQLIRSTTSVFLVC